MWQKVLLSALIFQVFDVVLNGDLTIASDLDVFERVGRGVAHDEYIEFEVKAGKILFEGDETEITRGKMRVEFIKVGEIWFTFQHFFCRNFSYTDNKLVEY